jgi:hypothetical protein
MPVLPFRAFRKAVETEEDSSRDPHAGGWTVIPKPDPRVGIVESPIKGEVTLRIWKKALSAAMSVALLASLTVSSSFAVVGAAGDSDQTNYLTCTTGIVASVVTCSQLADGASYVVVTAEAAAAPAAGHQYVFTITGGGTFANGTANFAAANVSADGKTITVAVATALTVADTARVIAPAAAGTSTINVVDRSFPSGTKTDVDLGSLTLTWLASSNLGVSVANSTIKVVDNGLGCADAAVATPVQDDNADAIYDFCVRLKDGNNNPVADTASVSVTIGNFGLLNATEGAAGNAQATNETTTGGDAVFGITGSGIPGTATITASVTYLGTTTALGTKTIVFSGDVASITATTAKVASSGGAALPGTVTFTAKDAAGNPVTTDINAVTPSVGAPFAAVLGLNYDAATDTAGTVTVTCSAAGSGTLTVKDNLAVGSVVSNAVTVYCSGALDTFTVAFDKDTVVPGGTATFTVNALDAGGRPAFGVNVVTPVVSAGAFIPGPTAPLANGKAVFTYLAPFNAGTATVLVSVAGAITTVTATDSISISAPAPIGFTFNTTGTALGNTLTGPFTPESKISTGGYITWRFDGGAAAAGKTIEIWAYKKVGLFTNPWSAPYLLTTRVANASGVAFANITSGSVIWLSIRPVLAATATDAAVWGSWSIGRWIH